MQQWKGTAHSHATGALPKSFSVSKNVTTPFSAITILEDSVTTPLTAVTVLEELRHYSLTVQPSGRQVSNKGGGKINPDDLIIMI